MGAESGESRDERDCLLVEDGEERDADGWEEEGKEVGGEDRGEEGVKERGKEEEGGKHDQEEGGSAVEEAEIGGSCMYKDEGSVEFEKDLERTEGMEYGGELREDGEESCEGAGGGEDEMLVAACGENDDGANDFEQRLPNRIHVVVDVTSSINNNQCGMSHDPFGMSHDQCGTSRDQGDCNYQTEETGKPLKFLPGNKPLEQCPLPQPSHLAICSLVSQSYVHHCWNRVLPV